MMRRFILLLTLLAIFCTVSQKFIHAQPDPDCTIKGIIVSEEKRLYILPDHKLYDQITVRPEKNEKWFCSQQEAERAGFLLVPNPGQAGRSTQQVKQAPPQQETAPVALPTPTPVPPEPEIPVESTVEDVPESRGQTAQPTAVEEVAETPESSEPVLSEQPDSPETTSDMQPDQTADAPWEQTEPIPDFQGEVSPFQVMTMLAPVLLPALIFSAVVFLFAVICLWVIFKKADQPGWLSLIPFVNLFILVKISGKPGWWFLVIMFVPFIGAILYILSQISLAEQFGKGALFGIGLIFLPMIFYPILAFGSAEYEGSFV